MVRSASVLICFAGALALAGGCLDPLYGRPHEPVTDGGGDADGGDADGGDGDAGDADGGGADAGDAGAEDAGADAGTDAGACPFKAPDVPDFDVMIPAERAVSLIGIEERSATWSDEAGMLCYVRSADGLHQRIRCARAISQAPLMFDAPVEHLALSVDWPTNLGDLELSSDGGELFFNMRIGGATDGRIYRSVWADGGFGPPGVVNAGISTGDLLGPTLSSDGLELFFSVQESGSRLHRLRRTTPAGAFATPERVVFGGGWDSDILNPSISANNHWMLFTSTVGADAGSVRLYVATRDCRDGPWSVPVPLDIPGDTVPWINAPHRPEWGPGNGIFFDHSNAGANSKDIFFAPASP